MSKLNQIETALKEIDQATFHKLCDTYLYALGYEDITPFGVSLGKDKTKAGTPDSYILLKNGEYIFIEYSTQSSSLFDKFSDDLSKCFDVTHTGIDVDKIQKIILCYNSVLPPDKIDFLAQICVENDCDFENIHIGRLAHDLLSRFPHIVKEFLGIEVDTEQILPPSEFIKEHQKSSFATPLDNEFYFRKEELNTIVDFLDAGSLVIVVGKPGVGKTKLAIEASKHFCEQHNDFLPYCISNKNLSLYEDLKSYFSDIKKYLIIVDDGNRLSDFEHVLRLLRTDNIEKQIKIIVTVRDYALEQILNKTKDYSEKKLVKIQKLENKEIKEILSSKDFGITNSNYLDRICYIAQGNPRLAIMAAKVALKTNDLGSLHNVTKIYDEYFSTIVDDLNELKNRILVKTLGLISFFRIIDKENSELTNKIYEVFGISENQFWENVITLQNFEVVDLYEKQIVKEADQVLSTYFFYKTFIKDEILSFSKLLEHFSGKYKSKINDSVIPTVNTFGYDFVTQKLQKHINYYWNLLKYDESGQMNFLNIFWFINPTKNLIFLQEKITTLPTKDITSIDFDCEPSDISDGYLKVLSKFRHARPEDFKTSLEIIFEYFLKTPELLPQILHYIVKNLMFDSDSYRQRYFIQVTLFQYLINKSTDTLNGAIYKRLIFKIANSFLKTRYNASRMEDKRTFAWQEFYLICTSEMKNLRKDIWQFLFKIFETSQDRHEIVKIIDGYISGIQYEPEKQICEFDVTLLLPFLSQNLDKKNYHHCLIVQRYLQTLDRIEIQYTDVTKLKQLFINEIYYISQIIEWDYVKNHEGLSIAEYDNFKRKQLADYFREYDYDEYLELFSHIQEILKYNERNESWRFDRSIKEIFINILKKDIGLFFILIEYIWSNDIQPPIRFAQPIVSSLFDHYPETHLEFYNLIQKNSFQSKDNWLLSFFGVLKSKFIDSFYLEQLYAFCDSSEAISVFWSFDFLEKYQSIDNDVIIKVISKMWEKVNRQNAKIRFDFLFNPHSKIAQNLKDAFKNNLKLLKDIYLYQDSLDSNIDYDGSVFKQILELDENFIVEYIKAKYARNEYLSSYDDHRDYGFIWQMGNYESIITKAINFLSAKSTFHGSDYLNVFFKTEKQADILPVIIGFFKKYIEINAFDIDSLNMVFVVITESFPEQRKSMIAHLLQKNAAIAIFKELYIEKRTYSGGSSFVPEYENRIAFWDSLKHLFTGASFLKHKLYIEDQIDYYQEMIKEDNRRNFLNDW